LATKPVLVVFFWLETHFSGDETRSHHHYGRELPFFGNQNKKNTGN